MILKSAAPAPPAKYSRPRNTPIADLRDPYEKNPGRRRPRHPRNPPDVGDPAHPASLYRTATKRLLDIVRYLPRAVGTAAANGDMSRLAAGDAIIRLHEIDFQTELAFMDYCAYDRAAAEARLDAVRKNLHAEALALETAASSEYMAAEALRALKALPKHLLPSPYTAARKAKSGQWSRSQ